MTAYDATGIAVSRIGLWSFDLCQVSIVNHPGYLWPAEIYTAQRATARTRSPPSTKSFDCFADLPSKYV